MSRVNPIKETEKVMQNPVSEFKPERGAKSINLTAIIVAAVVVALAGIGGGYAYWTHHEGNAYHEAVTKAETADAALTKAVGKAKDAASQYKADQLKEPKLLDKLNEQVKKAESLKGIPDDNPSEWLAWRLVSAKQANATDADEANAQAKALNAALKAVKDSKMAKELDGAKSQLKQGIDGASQTLKDTDGKVADNATRDSLTKAIAEANNTLAKKGVTDPKAYTDQKAKLDAAVKQVNDSKAAKEQADAEAAAQAQAQAQAAQAAAQSQRSYSQSYNSYGGSGSGYSSNRGYSAPQQSYTPSSNGGGSSYSGPTITGGGIANTSPCPDSQCPVSGEGLL